MEGKQAKQDKERGKEIGRYLEEKLTGEISHARACT